MKSGKIGTAQGQKSRSISGILGPRLVWSVLGGLAGERLAFLVWEIVVYERCLGQDLRSHRAYSVLLFKHQAYSTSCSGGTREVGRRITLEERDWYLVCLREGGHEPDPIALPPRAPIYILSLGRSLCVKFQHQEFIPINTYVSLHILLRSTYPKWPPTWAGYSGWRRQTAA